MRGILIELKIENKYSTAHVRGLKVASVIIDLFYNDVSSQSNFM